MASSGQSTGKGNGKSTAPGPANKGKGNDKAKSAAPAAGNKDNGGKKEVIPPSMTPIVWFRQPRATDYPTTFGGSRTTRKMECYLVFTDRMWTKKDVRVKLSPWSQNPSLQLHFEVGAGDGIRRAFVSFRMACSTRRLDILSSS